MRGEADSVRLLANVARYELLVHVPALLPDFGGSRFPCLEINVGERPDAPDHRSRIAANIGIAHRQRRDAGKSKKIAHVLIGLHDVRQPKVDVTFIVYSRRKGVFLTGPLLGLKCDGPRDSLLDQVLARDVDHPDSALIHPIYAPAEKHPQLIPRRFETDHLTIPGMVLGNGPEIIGKCFCVEFRKSRPDSIVIKLLIKSIECRGGAKIPCQKVGAAPVGEADQVKRMIEYGGGLLEANPSAEDAFDVGLVDHRSGGHPAKYFRSHLGGPSVADADPKLRSSSAHPDPNRPAIATHRRGLG